MKGLVPLIIGIFAILAFSWAGLTFVPSLQIGHIDPQMDEEGNDAYPAPRSGMAERGRKVYVANGCVYCHSQQIRPDYLAADVDRKWGQRRSAPRDYLFDRPVLLGKMRMGPDLSNVGKRAPVEDEDAPPANAVATPGPGAAVASAPKPGASPAAGANTAPAAPSPSVAVASNPTATAATSADIPTENAGPPAYSATWHHQHLYAPRSVTPESTMPAFRFLYQERPIQGEGSADAVKFASNNPAPNGYEIVPTYEAQCLVAYLMSLDQSHALKEVKSEAPASPPAPAKGVK